MSSRELLASLPKGKFRADLTSATIATNAYTTMVDPLPAACTAIGVAYTGRGILILAKGAIGSEVDLPIFLTPGMSNEMLLPLELAKGIRISAKALDQAVSLGDLVVTLYG